jgi:hypothetical protein
MVLGQFSLRARAQMPDCGCGVKGEFGDCFQFNMYHADACPGTSVCCSAPAAVVAMSAAQETYKVAE